MELYSRGRINMPGLGGVTHWSKNRSETLISRSVQYVMAYGRAVTLVDSKVPISCTVVIIIIIIALVLKGLNGSLIIRNSRQLHRNVSRL